MIITYFMPIGLMSFTYAMIGHELWGSQSIGECTQRQLEHIKSKRRVSVLLFKKLYAKNNDNNDDKKCKNIKNS